MTAISLLNPYAPQPVGAAPEANVTAGQANLPVQNATKSGSAGLSSDQSGQGTGSGTGTGGAQLMALLRSARSDMMLQKPTPKSIIEAQSKSDPTTAFLARQAQLRAEGEAIEEKRVADQAEAREQAAKAEARKAAEPVFEMPNPLPTAPILERDADA